jgi:hypothetical protein
MEKRTRIQLEEVPFELRVVYLAEHFDAGGVVEEVNDSFLRSIEVSINEYLNRPEGDLH